jgi:hypothetical protein
MLFAVVSARTPAAHFFAVAARPFVFFVQGFTSVACFMRRAMQLSNSREGRSKHCAGTLQKNPAWAGLKKVFPCGAFDE